MNDATGSVLRFHAKVLGIAVAVSTVSGRAASCTARLQVRTRLVSQRAAVLLPGVDAALDVAGGR